MEEREKKVFCFQSTIFNHSSISKHSFVIWYYGKTVKQFSCFLLKLAAY